MSTRQQLQSGLGLTVLPSTGQCHSDGQSPILPGSQVQGCGAPGYRVICDISYLWLNRDIYDAVAMPPFCCVYLHLHWLAISPFLIFNTFSQMVLKCNTHLNSKLFKLTLV